MADKLLLFGEIFESSSDENFEDNSFAAVILPAVAAAMIREDRIRVERYVEDVVPNYSDISFQRHFRLSRDTFNTVHDHLKDCPELVVTAHHGGRPAVPVTKQLMVTLWYLGTHDTIHRLSDRFGVSEDIVLNSRNSVITAVIRHLRTKIISWSTQQEKQVIKDHYERKNGFPN